jgi:ABC-type bacteriocin/lantibiotic exporter with double-glycine peptidase domain
MGLPAVPVLSLSLLILITLKLGVQAVLTRRSNNLIQQVQSDTVTQLLDGYLHLDWPNFKSQHTNQYFRRCATTAVDAAWVSQQCVTMISSSLILIFLIGLMLWEYPLASLALGTVFVGLNILTQRWIGQRQNQVSQDREAALQRWSLGMTETFSSFREIRVYGLERFFLNHLESSINALSLANKRLGFLPTLPRLILDFAVFFVLLSLVSIWLLLNRPISELVPQLVFYAVIARAILPAMINLLSTRAVLYGSIINVRIVLDELAWIRKGQRPSIRIASEFLTEASFRLENVTFRHASTLSPVIVNASIKIKHSSWLAVIGASGSGKSTLMELLSGIHVPESGRVVHYWPSHTLPRLAYVPQHVALLDGSIYDNIVFGYDAGDTTRIESVLHLACLDSFVAQHTNGYHTHIGADGSKLSGGQRQRLALARALYRQPDLLLLDEATSGLDEETENRLFSLLREHCTKMSVVFITHRQGTLRFADKIISLEGGQVLDVTGFDAYVNTN